MYRSLSRRSTASASKPASTPASHSFQRSVLATAVAAAAVAGAPVHAQDPADDRVIEEVIVTVNRIEQNLQDVAGTVQSFTADDLQALGINTEFANLQYAVPGLQIAKQEGKLEIFLRGIGSSDSDFSSDPSIAVHYNGVYLPRPRGIGPLFFDSQRVEINKGPQGTVRGRNATGGTINIISNRPDFEEVGGYVQGGLGNFDDKQVEAVINLPISDTFAARLAAWGRKHDGLYTNAFGSAGSFTTPSAQDDTAYRLSLAWEPNDRFAAYMQYTQAEVKSSGDPGAFSGRSFSAGETVEDLSDPWDQYFRTEGNFEQDIDTLIFNANYDFDAFGVEYNGSYNDLQAYNQNASREWQLGMSYPGSEAEADFIASGANPQRNLLVNDTFYQGDNSESQTHEVRFYSNSDGPLQWSAGAFYFQEDFEYFSWDVGNGFCGDSSGFVGPSSPVGPNTVSCWQNGLGGENRGDDSEVESMAFYADGSFDITDRLRVLGGIRYTDEEKTQRDSNAQYQFNWNAEFFFGFPGVNETSDLIIGEPGFRLKRPGDRTINDFGPGDSGKALFLDGVESFGLGDNWGRMLEACEEGVTCEVLVTSQFDPSGELGTIRATNSVEDSYVDWRIGVEYDFGDGSDVDTMTYATISTGTRSGGINRPLILGEGRQLDVTWDPEELIVYEVGAKNTFYWNDRAVRLNGAVFYYDYSDYVAQVLVDVPNPTPENPDATTQQVFTDNVADATILGLEIETNIDLPYNLNFNGALTWLDSEFENSAIVDARQNSNPVINVDGNQLPNVSEFNMNLRLSQYIDVDWAGIRSFDWTLSALYRSEYFLTAYNNNGYELDANGNTVEIPLLDMPPPNNNGALSDVGGAANSRFFWDEVDAFWLVNANAGVNFGDDERYRVDVWVENLTEEAFSTKGFVNSSVNIRYLNSPRMYGLRFRARF
ncbi:MAG: TonB-dependent receptor [Pseudomonadota bacterium]